MKDEIKEILELFKEYASGGMSGLYPPEETIKDLLDYITNLQTIEQQYSAILSENAELEDRLDTLKIEISSLMSRYFYEKDFCIEDTHLDKLLRIIDGDNILEGSDKDE